MDREREIQASVDILRERARRLPDVLAHVLASDIPALPLPRGDRTRFVVSGLGASEGPARVLSAMLSEIGLPAVFAPVSAFVAKEPPRADVLVIVSQQLSPNARIPLRCRAAYRNVALVSALNPTHDTRAAELDRAGVSVLVHPPELEDRILLRVLGPAAAALSVAKAVVATARVLGVEVPWAAGIAGVPEAVREALACGERGPPDLFDHWTALVASNGCTELLQLARVKLVEGLGLVDPPIWDACAVVHGPFQAFFERPLTLLCFDRRGDAAGARLRRGLEESVVAGRHRLFLHEGTLPGPLIVFEHDSAVLGLVLATLARSPRNLIRWPGQGADASIYAVSDDEPFV